MNIEFNLSFKSLFSQQRSLNYQSAGKEQVANASESVRSSSAEYRSQSATQELVSLGLYQEKSLINTTERLPELPESYVRVPKISPQQASGNILDFIERRIEAERKSGASEEKIDDLLAQARKGVEQGYASARGDLESLGLMSDELTDEIDQSYGLVQDGLDRLEGVNETPEELVATKEGKVEGSNNKSNDNTTNDNTTNDNNVNDQNQVTADRAATEPGPREFVKTSLYQQSSSDFSLTTQDGDVVRIRFSNELAFKSLASTRVGQQASIESLKAMAVFEFSVEGELDADELKAINDLLSELSDVASAFFEGDFEQAFEEALSLGFDGSEIAEFTLNLRQTQVQSVRSYAESLVSDQSQSQRFKPFVEQATRLEDLGQAISNSKLISSSEGLFSLLKQTLDFAYESRDYTSNVERFIEGFMKFQE